MDNKIYRVRGRQKAQEAIALGRKRHPHVKWILTVISDDRATVIAKLDGRQVASIFTEQNINVSFVVESMAMGLRSG